MAWYNTYRPKNFDEVFGQDLVKTVLQNTLKKNKIKHAYLFSGPKGVGKTTLARIFANNLNQTDQNPEASFDIIEMDAASHTGVDDIRQLIESAKTQPITGKYKIFIIDEVHMLSKNAMNALLKILEEPPRYLVFLLATTNEEKLLPTVMSRLTKLKLFNHTTEDIVLKLQQIAQAENLQIDTNALKLIAKHSGGSQRDAINLLETVSSYELDNYDLDNTAQLLGLLPQELICQTAEAFENGLLTTELISEIERKGVDGQEFLAQLLEFILDKSILGDRQFDFLVLPLAEVLDLQLPLTTPQSALAVLQVKVAHADHDSKSVKKKAEDLNLQRKYSPLNAPLTQSVGTNLSHEEPNNTPDKVVETEDTVPAQDHLQKESTVIPKKSEAIANLENKAKQKTPPQTYGDKVIGDITTFIASLTEQPDTPPTLKMIVADLSGEMREEKLVLQASNNTFLAGLKSPKIQAWILEKFEQNFGSKPIIILEIRAAEPKKKSAKIEGKRSTNSLNEVEQKHQNTESGEIFYKVYNQLPNNMEGKGVEVIKGPIPGPNETNQNWDNHASELFEFE